ncbi:hypothetical protein [Pseudoalteromonas sp. SG44-17]|uniref:hypothetical protein n=1 Tax=Pseudoalteromonas sp. SG44-17 TaxID=2760963 RepID=UPI0016018920|nr:hypothetical protein [Pseudoalteromonas sp. SG44-17]MBB1410576.1 hypothetical protein [Pseudoalteromonas sp. SG44-17]
MNLQGLYFTTALTLLLVGCGQSDIEAPPLQTESPYLCSSINDLRIMNEPRKAQKIAEISLSIMDKEYVGDSLIEEFHKLQLKKHDYKYYFYQTFFKFCESNASLGVNEAASLSLTKLYENISYKAGMATCRSVNEGILDYEDILEEIKNPTVMFSGVFVPSIKRVQKDPNYGNDFIQNNLADECEKKPAVRIWDMLGHITKPIAKKLWDKDQSALRAKKREEQKALEMEQEVAYQEDVMKFSKSLFETGGATCERFMDQYYVALISENKSEVDFDSVLGGMKVTLAEVAKGLFPYQKPTFDSILATNPKSLMEEVFNTCRYQRFNLLGSLRKISKIDSLKDPIEIELENLYREKNDASSMKAWDQYKMCRARNFKETVCFNESNSYYLYYLTESKIKDLRRQLVHLQNRINRRVPSDEMNTELRSLEKALLESRNFITELESKAISTSSIIHRN